MPPVSHLACLLKHKARCADNFVFCYQENSCLRKLGLRQRLFLLKSETLWFCRSAANSHAIVRYCKNAKKHFYLGKSHKLKALAQSESERSVHARLKPPPFGPLDNKKGSSVCFNRVPPCASSRHVDTGLDHIASPPRSTLSVRLPAAGGVASSAACLKAMLVGADGVKHRTEPDHLRHVRHLGVGDPGFQRPAFEYELAHGIACRHGVGGDVVGFGLVGDGVHPIGVRAVVITACYYHRIGRLSDWDDESIAMMAMVASVRAIAADGAVRTIKKQTAKRSG